MYNGVTRHQKHDSRLLLVAPKEAITRSAQDKKVYDKIKEGGDIFLTGDKRVLKIPA